MFPCYEERKRYTAFQVFLPLTPLLALFLSRRFDGHRELLLRPLELAAAPVVTGYLVVCLSCAPGNTTRGRCWAALDVLSAKAFAFVAFLESNFRSRGLRFSSSCNFCLQTYIFIFSNVVRLADMSPGRCSCPIGQRRQLKSTAKQLDQCSIPFWKISLEDCKHRLSDVADVELALLCSYYYDDASVEAQTRLCRS